MGVNSGDFPAGEHLLAMGLGGWILILPVLHKEGELHVLVGYRLRPVQSFLALISLVEFLVVCLFGESQPSTSCYPLASTLQTANTPRQQY